MGTSHDDQNGQFIISVLHYLLIYGCGFCMSTVHTHNTHIQTSYTTHTQTHTHNTHHIQHTTYNTYTIQYTCTNTTHSLTHIHTHHIHIRTLDHKI